jgi:ATP-dependent Clp endopeptidase proteolytic subunit ClpP
VIFKTNGNNILAVGSIWSGDGLDFISTLTRLEASYNDIDVQLHTYGGSVFDGNLIINALQNSKANITLTVIGIAASMGAIALTAVKNVKIVDNGYIMIHRPSSGVFGNADDLESVSRLLRMMDADFVKRLIARTGKSKEEVKEWLSRDTWFSAELALRNGLVNEVIPSIVEPIYIDEGADELGELEMYNRYACALLTENPLKQDINFNLNMKQLLITALALTAVNAQSSDTAVMDAVNEKFRELQASLDLMKQAKVKAENDLKAYKASQITAMIDQASKKAVQAFTEDERKMYQNIGENSGIVALAHVLTNVGKPAQGPDISGQIGKGGKEGREAWSFDQWQKEDPQGLEKMAVDNPEAFKKLFNEKYEK